MPFGLRNSQQYADHLHRQFGRHVDHEIERLAIRNLVEQVSRPRPQVVLHAGDHPRCQARADQATDMGMPRIVHHVQHLARDGEILQQGAAKWAPAAGHRRVGHRILQHREGFGVGRDGPEALAVGRVVGRRMPVHRCIAAMDREQVVRKTVCEVVQIGEVDAHHGHRIAPDVYLAASG
jgi:hypothetical protein